MSYHVVQILTHGALLARGRGFLVCRPSKDAAAAVLTKGTAVRGWRLLNIEH